jgi:SNF2 family DNA or RNA helicase
MLIYKSKCALLFRLKEPSRITNVIATARLVKHQGDVLVAVPHKPDETRVLRNLGFDAPPPISYYYDYPGLYKPFEAQERTCEFASMHDRLFILNSMGTGKTSSSLWTYDYLRKVKVVRRVLVIAPLSTLERTWADTVFKSFPHLSFAVLYGSAARRKKLLAAEHDVYIINTDGVAVIEDELKDRPDIDLVIVDEVAMMRNQRTDRWKTMNNVINKQCPRKAWGLTGAPIPNEPTDAWAQAKLINPTNPDVPKYFSTFRDKVMRQTGPYSWTSTENALDEVAKILQPSIRFSLEDCVDLPESVLIERDVEMTSEQKDAYNDMVKKLTAEYAGGQIMAVNEAVKASKLVQIACGVAYDAGGMHVVLPSEPRMNELVDIIQESEGKVLVFAPLTGVILNVAHFLRKKLPHIEVGVVHGGTTKDERDEIFRRFQDPHDQLGTIVANPGTMSHGLTLTEATTTCWYAPTNSNDTYTQANARVRRPGQKRASVIVHMAASKVERKMYARLQKKGETQGVLLDMLENQEVMTE